MGRQVTHRQATDGTNDDAEYSVGVENNDDRNKNDNTKGNENKDAENNDDEDN